MQTNESKPESELESIAAYHNDLKQIELEGYELGVRKARNALYWTAGLVFAGEMIAMFASGGAFNVYILLIAIFEAAVFVALALWTKKKPYTAIMSGLITFIVIILISAAGLAYSDGITGFLKGIFSGIFVKVIILVNLIKALKDAKTLEEARAEQS